jgi:hypothetical protein
MDAKATFVPRNAAHSATDIANVLYAFYKTRSKDEVTMHLKSTKQMLDMLTPDACQLYVDSVYNDVDSAVSEEQQVLAETEIKLDILEQLGVLAE